MRIRSSTYRSAVHCRLAHIIVAAYQVRPSGSETERVSRPFHQQGRRLPVCWPPLRVNTLVNRPSSYNPIILYSSFQLEKIPPRARGRVITLKTKEFSAEVSGETELIGQSNS